ncbi:MAG: hypothetical protein AAFW60_06515 [Pseudomonadota bacterium]
MTKTHPFCFATLIAMIMAPWVQAQQVTTSIPESCTYAGSYETHFSSKRARDTVSVRVEGDNCNDPVLFIDVNNPDGETVFAIEMGARMPTYDCGEMVDCVSWAFDGAMFNHGEGIADRLPPLADANDSAGFYVEDEDAYVHAVANESPLFCYQAGKSFADCAVYIDGKAVIAFSTGS